MIVIVKHPFKVPKAESLMEGQPSLKHYFTQLSGNSWELKKAYEGEKEKAYGEVCRYFNQTKIAFAVEDY